MQPCREVQLGLNASPLNRLGLASGLHAGLSKELNFTMTKEAKLSSLPFTLAITADTGVNNATDLNIKGAP
jgi:hypothetical protein